MILNDNNKNFLGKISEYFINKYRVVYLVIIAIILLGVQSYTSLPREEMPEVTMPFALVTVTYSGAAPQEIETLITDKIETKIQELDDIESITSTSSNSVSSIIVEFEVGTDIDDKINKINNKITEIQNELPEDSNTPMVRGFETSDKPIMTVNIGGDYDLVTLKSMAEDI